MTQRPNHPPPFSHIPATLRFRSISQHVEKQNDAGCSPSLPPSPFTMHHSTSTVVPRRGGENLPPRKSHRRSNSDVTTAMMPHTPNSLMHFSSFDRSISDGSNLAKEEPESESMDDIIRAYFNLDDNIDVLNSVEMESSDDVKGLKRRASGGDIAPSNKHYRSVSMDSCFLGNLNFGDEMLRLSSAKVYPTNSGEGTSNAAYSEFSAAEMEKISADKKLAELVMVDPNRVKRILANRASAARSKEKKMQYTAQLEHEVKILQNKTTTLSTQLTHFQRESTELQNENSELKFRFQAMEQQAQLRDALSESLIEEVQRLKMAVIGEPSCSESKMSLNPGMFQQQLRISQLPKQQHSNQSSTMKAYYASNEYL